MGEGAELGTHQALLDEQAEEDSIAHLPQVLEAHCLQLCILHNVLQLVVEELQDACGSRGECWGFETSTSACPSDQYMNNFS